MIDQAKSDTIDRILERAANEKGDITQQVMSRYYSQHPQAKEHFKRHSQFSWNNLEGEMVERSLYCFMYWAQSPGEIEFLLMGSVPHHADILGIPPDFYQGLIDATAAVIESTIPEENEDEKHIWTEMYQEIHDMFLQGKRYVDTSRCKH